MRRFRNYKEDLFRELKNPEEAFYYLQDAFEDEDRRVFLLAIRDVVEAQGGFTKFSRKAGLSREHLYDVLSLKGNPELNTLKAILDALGFRLSIESKKQKKAA